MAPHKAAHNTGTVIAMIRDDDPAGNNYSPGAATRELPNEGQDSLTVLVATRSLRPLAKAAIKE